jgi:MFS transporter, DHA2 family, multidrug resistance protein
MSSIPSIKPGTASAPWAAPRMSASQTSGLLLGLALAAWMEFYTFDAVNLVLPDMAGSFGISQDQASWFLTIFSSAFFFGMPLSIWMANHVTPRRYVLGSALFFAVASVGCAVAPSFEAMLFWRAILGFAGAGLSMWWRASVYLLVPGPQRGKSIMRISVILYLSTAAGLLFAGYVTDNLNWRLIFVPNVAFVAVAAWLLKQHYPHVPRVSDPRVEGADKPGIALLGIALVSLQTLLSRGEVDDWFGSPQIQALAWITAFALVLFIVWQTHPRNHMHLLRLDLMRDRNVIASMFLGIAAGIILTGSLYALPEFLRNVDPRELDASHTGQIMCVYALAAAANRPIVTKSISKFGQRKALVFALVMLIASMLLFSRCVTLQTPLTAYVLPLVLYAFCLAPLLSAIGGGTVSRMPPGLQLDAVAIYMSFRQLGSALGVTLVSSVLSRRETLHSSRLFEHLRAGGSSLDNWTSTAAQLFTQRGGYTALQARLMAERLLGEAGAGQAATLAYADAFLFMAAIGLVALCLVPIMSPSPVVKK